MTNQSFMLVSIVLCSLGGWYVVITKYLELKAMSKDKFESHDSGSERLDPVSHDFNKIPENFNLTGQHIPGMGPPPHPNLPFSIPEDLLAAMNKLRAQPLKHEVSNSTVKQASSNTNKTGAQVASSQSPSASSQKREICNWATILHLSGLAIITGIPFLNIVVPSILWLLKKEQHPFLARHGRDVINFQITLTIMQFLCLGAGAMFIWLTPHAAQGLFAWTKTLRIVFGTSMHLPYNIFTIVPFFWGCVVMVRGAVAAYNGSTYKYPYSQPFLFTTISAPVKKQEVVPQAKPQAMPVFNNINFS